VILVTVGEQLPFDRLIRTMDLWAGQQQQKVFAQIGRSTFRPSHIQYKDFLEQGEFRQRLQEAQLVVAHAGMGTIISALETGTPIIVMPRKAALGEHRNDHQIATASRFLALSYIAVAFDENELRQKLADMEDICKSQETLRNIDPSPLLMKSIRDFLPGN